MLKPTVEKIKIGHRRRSVYVARLGEVTAEGDSAKQATDACEAFARNFLEEANREPYVLRGFKDPMELWILYANSFGWAYAIDRVEDGRVRRVVIQCGADRRAAIESMQSHWFNNGLAGVINGIVALCTDQREWICSKCHYPQHGPAPYHCNNPACGHTRGG